MTIQVLWEIRFVEAGAAGGPMQVPSAQSLKATNIGGFNGGVISLPDNPTGAQVDTALTTVATNAKAFFDNGAPLAQMQGWNSGNP